MPLMPKYGSRGECDQTSFDPGEIKPPRKRTPGEVETWEKAQRLHDESREWLETMKRQPRGKPFAAAKPKQAAPVEDADAEAMKRVEDLNDDVRKIKKRGRRKRND